MLDPTLTYKYPLSVFNEYREVPSIKRPFNGVVYYRGNFLNT